MASEGRLAPARLDRDGWTMDARPYDDINVRARQGSAGAVPGPQTKLGEGDGRTAKLVSAWHTRARGRPCMYLSQRCHGTHTRSTPGG